MFEDWTNCQVCEHNPTGIKCELFGRVIGMHGCSSGIERKPRNHFEMLKAMSMEEMLVLFTAEEYDGAKCFSCPVPHPCPDLPGEADCRECFGDWLKEEIE